MVTRYDAGERIVLARNPHYWRKSAAGTPSLPGGLTLDIVPSRMPSWCGWPAGRRPDAVELRAEDIRTLRADADGGRVVVTDVGRGLDRQVLWFNLGPSPIEPDRAFLREDAFRQAVSLAVDRTGFANTVFLGAAEPSSEPVAAANTAWTAVDLPRPSYNPAQAATLLDGLGLRDRDNDGLREDAAGRPVRSRGWCSPASPRRRRR